MFVYQRLNLVADILRTGFHGVLLKWLKRQGKDRPCRLDAMMTDSARVRISQAPIVPNRTNPILDYYRY